MSERMLQERMLDTDGSVIVDWHDGRTPDDLPSEHRNPWTEKDWRALVRYLNKKAKAEGSRIRYRSVVSSRSW
jgi:hypothetical protein